MISHTSFAAHKKLIQAERAWLDPHRVELQGLTTIDVANALKNQNIEVAGGAGGAPPTSGGLLYQVGLNASGRFTTVYHFSRLILKTTPDGGHVRLSDVGRAELGAEDYTGGAHWNGSEGVEFGVIQAQNANALETATNVRATLEKLSKTFPPGVSYVIPFDATLFVRESIKEVVQTLAIAVLLVVLVIYAFIQNWRMTLVPMITIPVSLIGTFALMKALGFSINTLTLFGLTLASGLVVDDAIVVIENIARFVQEKHMSPLRGAEEAMREISGAVIATSLVLLAVFIPVAFFLGSTGLLYKQFAISLFTALTLAPPLSALLLGQEHAPTSAIFRAINWAIAKLRSSYHALLPRLIKQRLVVFGVFVLALGVTGATYSRTPSAFIPDEDQGYLIVVLQAPAGTSSDFERRVSARVAARIRAAVPEARGVFSVDGFGFTGNASNRGIAFIPLKPWNERAGSEHTFRAILKWLAPIVASEPYAQVFAFNPPSVQGIGNFDGFQFQVLDQGDIGFTKTMAGVRSLIAAVNSDPHFAAGFTSFRTDTPQFNLQINRDKAERWGAVR